MTNGFYLKFENSGNLGLDSSGQGNNFTTEWKWYKQAYR